MARLMIHMCIKSFMINKIIKIMETLHSDVLKIVFLPFFKSYFLFQKVKYHTKLDANQSWLNQLDC